MPSVDSTRQRIGAFIISVATALGIIVVVIPLFLNPIWVSFEQDRAQATAWTGFSAGDLRAATDAILADLVFGSADFDVTIDGDAVLEERERVHMRDVRGVFIGFFVVSLIVVVAGVIIAIRWRRARRQRPVWHAIRQGALGLIVTLLVVGALALTSFDVLFEAFHRVFFAGGSYTFDPATERLVQLFPFQFWQETAVVLGVIAIALAGLVAAAAYVRERPR